MSGNPSGADLQSVRANKLDLVERLADDLAHEIKNPLHSMVINLEVLKRRIARPGGSEPDELMRYVGVLGSELDRVNRRVELLLRMVRPSRGAEPTTLAASAEELLELLELERERRGISLRFEPAPVPVRGHLPPDTTRQIVLNLLLDALDALHAGGELEVRTEVDEQWSRLVLRAVPQPDADAGPRGSARGDTRLEVARSLSEELGGHVQLAAEPGSEPDGGTVVLWLPLAPPAS